jgi:hypothetical protein
MSYPAKKMNSMGITAIPTLGTCVCAKDPDNPVIMI